VSSRAQYAVTKFFGKSILYQLCMAAVYTANCGACVRTGRRQSIPSSNIESCAGVSDTVPFVGCGQINRPRSNRFEKRQSPSPSNH
jgi:hypothetical protein